MYLKEVVGFRNLNNKMGNVKFEHSYIMLCHWCAVEIGGFTGVLLREINNDW